MKAARFARRIRSAYFLSSAGLSPAAAGAAAAGLSPAAAGAAAEPEPAPIADPEPEPEPELFDADVPAQQTEAPAEEPTEAPATEAALDELEETPDFLEETPEHDRLWFERKPPRDFDF